MERRALAERLGAPTGAAASSAPVVVAERDPRRFQAAFARAVAGTGPVFLADPNWGEQEKGQFDALAAQTSSGSGERGWLAIPTGGSSGRIKLARHDAATIAAAVDGFCRHFEWKQVNAVGVLPLHHVGGLMGWLRCALTGGEFVAADWAEVVAGTRPAVPEIGRWALSLVPSQLVRLLEDPAAVDWLRRFDAVLMGGAAAWPGLLDATEAAGVALAPSYGSTETLGMVAALRPEEVRTGRRDCGEALPHASLETADDGVVVVRTGSLFRGYWPDADGGDDWRTGDLGQRRDGGGWVVTGRADSLINSGGEKINPAEVEAVLREVLGTTDVMVLGVPSGRWGEQVVVAMPTGLGWPLAQLKERLAGRLAAFKHPKACIELADWPVNAMGKVARAEVVRRVRAQWSGSVDPGGE